MESLLPTSQRPAGLEKARSYIVVSSGEIKDLEDKVSKLIDGGSYRLHGQPFAFRELMCHALALYNIGK